MTVLLYLDIDGVLNDHRKLPGGYCGIDRDRAALLNCVLDEVPECKLVISSAWRYLVHEGSMTRKGFEFLLLSSGVKAHLRIYGFTRRDPAKTPPVTDADAWRVLGLKWRAWQIEQFNLRHRPEKWAAIDDLPLDLPAGNFVQTDPAVGLTDSTIEKVIRILAGKN